jgi:hypothetical protein
VVDRLVQGARADLASPVTIDRHHDVRQQFGQLRLMVGAHTFAGGLPFGLGTHDLGRYRVPADPARAPAARTLAVARCALVTCCRWDGRAETGRRAAHGCSVPDSRTAAPATRPWAGAKNPGELPPRLIDARNAAGEYARSGSEKCTGQVMTVSIHSSFCQPGVGLLDNARHTRHRSYDLFLHITCTCCDGHAKRRLPRQPFNSHCVSASRKRA